MNMNLISLPQSQEKSNADKSKDPKQRSRKSSKNEPGFIPPTPEQWRSLVKFLSLMQMRFRFYANKTTFIQEGCLVFYKNRGILSMTPDEYEVQEKAFDANKSRLQFTNNSLGNSLNNSRNHSGLHPQILSPNLNASFSTGAGDYYSNYLAGNRDKNMWSGINQNKANVSQQNQSTPHFMGPGEFSLNGNKGHFTNWAPHLAANMPKQIDGLAESWGSNIPFNKMANYTALIPIGDNLKQNLPPEFEEVEEEEERPKRTEKVVLSRLGKPITKEVKSLSQSKKSLKKSGPEYKTPDSDFHIPALFYRSFANRSKSPPSVDLSQSEASRKEKPQVPKYSKDGLNLSQLGDKNLKKMVSKEKKIKELKRKMKEIKLELQKEREENEPNKGEKTSETKKLEKTDLKNQKAIQKSAPKIRKKESFGNERKEEEKIEERYNRLYYNEPTPQFKQQHSPKDPSNSSRQISTKVKEYFSNSQHASSNVESRYYEERKVPAQSYNPHSRHHQNPRMAQNPHIIQGPHMDQDPNMMHSFHMAQNPSMVQDPNMMNNQNLIQNPYIAQNPRMVKNQYMVQNPHMTQSQHLIQNTHASQPLYTNQSAYFDQNQHTNQSPPNQNPYTIKNPQIDPSLQMNQNFYMGPRPEDFTIRYQEPKFSFGDVKTLPREQKFLLQPPAQRILHKNDLN